LPLASGEALGPDDADAVVAEGLGEVAEGLGDEGTGDAEALDILLK